MKILSRRKFVKSVLTGAAALTAAKLFDTIKLSERDVCLSVDQDGNAILQGAQITVTEKGQSRVSVRKG